MWYAIISQDVENSLPLRKVHRPAHIARITELNDVGRVLIAGPHPAEDSSLIVVQFDSLSEAQEWANNDPYNLNGVYQSVMVKPFMKILP